ncbi:MAG TPA: hypothetical protein DCZ92_03855 [Elusimicrobia bacterium]|nr:MAG: hypothetical protein A2016_01250 [Elusimicrobia bacterium GWF2_62_30]HBA59951.1 hypothetical protein [Elusimicrobiota bacterium]
MISAFLLAALAAAGTAYLRTSMPAAEVVRKLSGVRLALAFYRVEHKNFPASFSEVITSGKLEGVPDLKLYGHFKSAKVRPVSSFTIKDTGGWTYVNAPADPQFGLLYIDCSHADEKGRFWSEF